MALNRRDILKGAAAAGTAATLTTSAHAADRPLSGKSALITGCSSGFGYATALHFARLGAKVIASMRNLPRPEADQLMKEAKTEKLDINIVEIDVTSDTSVIQGVAQAEKISDGPIDILVNNAGIGLTGPIEVQDMEATRLMFETNVFGVQRMIRAAVPKMRAAKRGVIFNISSQLGRVIIPSTGHYSPTKFALEALSEAMAYELVPHGIDVCVIQPGGYPTKVWVNRNALGKALAERIEPERKAAYPALVARMGTEDGSGRTADVNDVPRAMAEIAAMQPGKRPLRSAVHPGRKPQEAINKISAETQIAMLGDTPFGPWVKAAHD